jgi:hypothetical protein
MAEEIFEALVEKPINGPREIPPGRTPLGPTGPEEVDNLPQPTPEEEQQVDMMLGELKDFIWDEGYNSIVKKLKKGQDKLPEVIGEIAGRMVNKEVKAADEGEGENAIV